MKDNVLDQLNLGFDINHLCIYLFIYALFSIIYYLLFI